MDWDELQKKPAPKVSLGDNLETLSIGELERRMVDFRNEIARIEAELARKRAHEAAASALFKS
jgi:uncharacterized small protein (DUF1192 family)